MKILIAVDGSAPSLQAVRHALTLVEQGLKAGFVIANVQEPATLYEVVTAPDPELLHDMRAAAGADLIAPAEALLDAARVDYESLVVSGDPAHSLVELAEEYGCDAIFVGAWGTGDLTAALLGSVSHEVLKASHLPVTVVRLAEPAEEPAAEGGSEGAADAPA